MNIVEYGAPDIQAMAGSILAMPPATDGLTSFMVVTEQGRPVPFCWTATQDRLRLVTNPDGFSGLAYTDAALIAATSIMVGFYLGRIRLVRFAPADWGAAGNQTWAPPPVGMSPDRLAQQTRDATLPSGTVPQRDIGA